MTTDHSDAFKPLGDQIPRGGNAFTGWLGSFLLARLGFKLVGELPNEPRFIILGVPHTSNWDFIIVILVMLKLKLQINWIAKQSMFRWPFVGLLKKLGGVPIDRKAAGGVVEATVKALKTQDKLIIVLAPEGTRSAAPVWKTGFHRIAKGADVPVVLGNLDYKRKVLTFGPSMRAGEDAKADINWIRDHYINAEPKHAERWHSGNN